MNAFLHSTDVLSLLCLVNMNHHKVMKYYYYQKMENHHPYANEKLRTATYTAAVCKFRGGPSVAQLSSAFPYLSCFPNAADMLPLSSSST